MHIRRILFSNREVDSMKIIDETLSLLYKSKLLTALARSLHGLPKLLAHPRMDARTNHFDKVLKCEARDENCPSALVSPNPAIKSKIKP
jgi:hypothetical protein